MYLMWSLNHLISVWRSQKIIKNIWFLQLGVYVVFFVCFFREIKCNWGFIFSQVSHILNLFQSLTWIFYKLGFILEQHCSWPELRCWPPSGWSQLEARQQLHHFLMTCQPFTQLSLRKRKEKNKSDTRGNKFKENGREKNVFLFPSWLHIIPFTSHCGRSRHLFRTNSDG